MLKTIELKKSYKTKNGEVKALDGVNIELGSKGLVCILGKSGSGKSTLLNILGGLDKFDSGDLVIKDKSFKTFKDKDWDSYRNTYLGFIFQEYNLIDNYTIGQNIKLALELQSYPKNEIDDKVVEILNKVDLEGVIKRKPNQLSGGQKQRIAIARALVKSPEIILADEPTGNLDSGTGKIIINNLKELSKEKLVIMVSHDRETAFKYADRIIEMKDGKVINDKFNHGNAIGEPAIEKIVEVDTKDAKDVFIKYKGRIFVPATKEKDLKGTAVILDNLVNADEDAENLAETSLKEKSMDKFKLIKSNLPFKYSLKLSVKNMFRKKIKLLFTLVLFVAALGFFGISETVNRFDPYTSKAVGYDAAGQKYIDTFNTDDNRMWTGADIWNYNNVPFDSEYYDLLSENDLNYHKIYHIGQAKVLLDGNEFYQNDDKVYYPGLARIAEVNTFDSDIKLKYGRFPENKTEAVISDFAALNYTGEENALGSVITINNLKLEVVGIMETNYHDYDILNGLEESERWEKYGQLHMKYSYDNSTYYSKIYTYKNTYSDYLINSTDEQFLYEELTISAGIDLYSLPYKKNNDLGENEIIIPRAHLESNFLREEDILGSKIDAVSYKNNKRTVTKYIVAGFTDGEFTYISNERYNDFVQKQASLNELFVELPSSIDKTVKFFKNDLNKSVKIRGSISEHVDSVLSFKLHLSHIFNIISLVLGIFVMMLMYSMISASVLAKKREIGTLRAIGAKGLDVAKIFITEAVIIGLINYAVAIAALTFVTNFINNAIYKEVGVELAIFNLTPFIILELLLVSLIISVASAFLPAKRVATMKPIDAIRSN